MSIITNTFDRAKRSLPGGVGSSTRYNSALEHPMYVTRADGSRFASVDGYEYIDMCSGHGAALLGHAHPAIIAALEEAARLGVCCAFDTPHTIELAETVCNFIPCAERIRFTNSGSEATLHAIRLCRAVSGRDKIIRFTGHFHGYHEHTYIGGHPPPEALEDASHYRESAGIPEAFTQYIIALPFNDLGAVENALEKDADEIGTVILEPIDFNSGGIHPLPGYLEGLRSLTQKHNVLLFFDEIQSCFKAGTGGAQKFFGVIPDICTIGKSLGGGMPLSAICGAAQIMDRYKPFGDVQHSGTFNAPLPSVLAGKAFCRTVSQDGFYPALQELCDFFYNGLDEIIARVGIPIQAPRHGARFGLMMGLENAPVSYVDALKHRKDAMLEFVRQSAGQGVYFHDYGGAPCHHGFGSAHTIEDLSRVLEAVEISFKKIKDLFVRKT